MSTTGVIANTVDEIFINNVVKAATTQDVALLQSTVGADRSRLTNTYSNGLNAVHAVGKTGIEAACAFMVNQYPDLDLIDGLIFGAAQGGHEACTLSLIDKFPQRRKLNFELAVSGAVVNNQQDLLMRLLQLADSDTLYNSAVEQAICENKLNLGLTLLQAAGSFADFNSAALNAARINDSFCLDMLARAKNLADYQKIANRALNHKRELLAQAIIELAQEKGRKLDYNALARDAALRDLKITLDLLKLAGDDADYFVVANMAQAYPQLRSEILMQKDAVSKPKQTFSPMYHASTSSKSTDELTQLRNLLAAAVTRIDALEKTVDDLRAAKATATLK